MRAVEASLEEDLAVFSRFLHQQRVPHRIFEERGRQVLEVRDAAAAAAVRESYAAWRRGDFELVERPRAPADPAGGGESWLTRLRRYPVLCLVIGVAIAVFPFSVSTGDGRLSLVTVALLIVDLRGGDTVSAARLLADLEPWRWLTPMFLHFSVVHLLFNCAICVEFGRRVEQARGSLALLGLLLIIGCVSNLSQGLFSAYPIFGGLSGIAYGLLGYLLVMARRWPYDPAWQLPPGLAIGALLFLVLFSTGATEPFGLHVANAAHWSGLAAGALLGVAGRGRSA